MSGAGCACGLDGFPGRCPGAASCPYAGNERPCSHCKDEPIVKQFADDSGLCATCLVSMCEDCGEVRPLRVLEYEPYARNVRVCEACFDGGDTGPCWDDLPEAGRVAA